MSTLKVNKLRDTAGSADAITLDPNGGAVLAGVTTVTSVKVGAAVTISESGIEASGIGITCANINGTQISGRRNIIINGAMNIAQRGTSSTSSGMNSVDRFAVNFSGTDEAPTQAQVTLSSSDTPYSSGFRYALKITNGNQTSGGGAADYVQIVQKIEAQDMAGSGWNYTSSSSNITLSFWVKSSVAQTMYARLNAEDASRAFSFAFSATTSWTKIIKTIPGNSNLVFNNDNGVGIALYFIPFYGTNYTTSDHTNDAWITDSSSNQVTDMTTTWYTTNDATFEVTGVQLEVGSQATAFEHRSYGEELDLCTRYCQVMTSNATSERINFANVVVHGAGNGVYIMVGLLPMRTAPSVTTEGSFQASVITGGWTATNVSSITSEFTTANGNDKTTWGYDGMLSASIADSCTVGLSGQIFSSSGFGQFVFSAEL